MFLTKPESRRRRAALFAAAVFGSAACSLISPNDETLAGGARCANAEKECGGSCVPHDRPETGCAETSCAPCSFAHGASRCAQGMCAISACEAGFADCNNAADDGCEADLRASSTHCGACDTACDTGSRCERGACVSTLGCAPGTANCDADSSNGCEVTLATDSTHCGACGNRCEAPFVAAVNCNAGRCELLSCAPGRADCDASFSNGCEVDTVTDPAHCGKCGSACSPTQLCVAASCVPRCHAMRAQHDQARVAVNPVGLGVGTGDFTLELWLARHAGFDGRGVIVMNEDNPVNGVRILSTQNDIRCELVSDKGSSPQAGSAFLLGPPLHNEVWTHLACVRSGNTLTLFAAGQVAAKTAVSASVLELSSMAFGMPLVWSAAPASRGAPVSIGPTRFSNTARYSGAFSPKAKWPLDANTVAQWLTQDAFQPTAPIALLDEAGANNNGTHFGGFTPILAGVGCGE